MNYCKNGNSWGKKMRIDELVKRLEKIEKKHNLHFKVRKYIFETEIFIKLANEDLVDLMIARIYERKANALETIYVNFLLLEDEVREELLDIFVEYANTPIEERLKERLEVIQGEKNVNWVQRIKRNY